MAKLKFKEGQIVKHIFDNRAMMVRAIPTELAIKEYDEHGWAYVYSCRYIDHDGEYIDNNFAEFELQPYKK